MADGRGERGMTRHVPYFHELLNADFCIEEGEPWPCLAYRQAHPRCRCSHSAVAHSRREGMCWQHPCACRAFDAELSDSTGTLPHDARDERQDQK